MGSEELRQALVELLPRLRRYAYALTGNRADADDLLQTTVERLLGKGIEAGIPVDRWSFRVCKNAWLDEVRSRAVRHAVDIDEQHMAEELQMDGEKALLDSLACQQVRQVMQTLPEEQRAALALVAIEGFSYAEAADILGSPIGTVMSRIARARKAMLAFLQPFADYPTGA